MSLIYDTMIKLEWKSSLLWGMKPVCVCVCVCMYKRFTSYLDEWVDHSHIWAGVENLVEVGLSVDQLQLVEFLIILEEEKEVISRLKGSRVSVPLKLITGLDQGQKTKKIVTEEGSSHLPRRQISSCFDANAAANFRCTVAASLAVGGAPQGSSLGPVCFLKSTLLLKEM